MEKENKFMLKFSRIFTSSCKTQDISEVIDHQNPIFTPPQKPTTILQTPLMEEDDEEEEEERESHRPTKQTLSFHSPYYYPSMMCKPRCPETFDQMVRENCIIATTGTSPYPRRKIAGKYSLLSPITGRRCPPASPASPLFQREKKQGKSTTKKKKKKKKQRQRNKNGGIVKTDKTHFMKDPYGFSSSNETDFGDWFSSDDEREDDEETVDTLFFSSKSFSLSSDSDFRPNMARTRVRNRRRKPGSKPVRAGSEVGAVPLKGKVEDTFAVVKSSSDPYSDFRTSMVEMIIEKQIFGTKELEELLQCFLSLNSPHHHRVIVEVFTEIWEALFSYLS